MDRILIVDGHNLMFQMFFGMPNKIINKDGKAIQGVLGFVGALLKIIKIVNPTHLIVLFDSEKRNIRSDIYEDYKANRIDYSQISEDENPFIQLPDIFKSLDVLSIKYEEVEKYEVDDVIASYVFKYNKENEIIISSFDSDFFQLINKNVQILRYRGKNTIICDTDYLKMKYDIIPESYSLFKSLVGDSSDNIKGIPKIGIKTASELVNKFYDIKNLLNNIENIGKVSIRQSLDNNKEQLMTNYKLIKLNDEAPIPYLKDEIKYADNNLSTNQVLQKVGLK